MHSFIRYIPLFCPFLWNQLCFVLLFIGNVPENVHKHKNRKREREKILSESIRWIYVNIGNRNENRFMEQLWQEIIEWIKEWIWAKQSQRIVVQDSLFFTQCVHVCVWVSGTRKRFCFDTNFLWKKSEFSLENSGCKNVGNYVFIDDDDVGGKNYLHFLFLTHTHTHTDKIHSQQHYLLPMLCVSSNF